MASGLHRDLGGLLPSGHMEIMSILLLLLGCLSVSLSYGQGKVPANSVYGGLFD